MNKLNSARLRRDYPEIFAPRRGERTPFGLFGFECGDGWYELLDRLCRDIVEICRRQHVPIPAVAQVKEKFGGLRFYLEGGAPEAVHERIEEAEEESTRICERCGEPGELKAGDSGYWQTLCGRCRERGR